MKKMIAVLAALVIISLVLIYTFIPGTITVSKSVFVKANEDAVFRKLRNDSSWTDWWPGSSSVNNQGKRVFTWNEKNNFLVMGEFFNAIRIGSSLDGDSSESILSFLPGNKDSMEVRWQTSFTTDKNPITRVREYFFANRINAAFDAIINTLGKYISEVKNIYGFPFKEETVPFEFLVSIKDKFDHDPTTVEIYSMINKLKPYIQQNEAKETGSPLLYTWLADSTHFEAQLAVPIDKKIPETKEFSLKWMLKGGNIIAANVSGGKQTVAHAMKAIDLYVGDHKRNRVAIPFQQLITNRLTEKDTSKWVTKVYYPVI